MLASDKTYLLKQNEALFEATLNEFSSKQFDLASTNIIIKNSDYNKGSFYYRFKTKEEVYYALIDYVYTLGIIDLNAREIKLNNIFKEEEILDLLFLNMKNIWEQDPRYFKLLQKLYLESDSIKELIYSNCIESSVSRIIDRLIYILKQKKYPYIDILLNSINSLLFTHFKVFNNIETELKDIKKFLFNHQTSYELEPRSKKLDLSGLKGNLNYLITDEKLDFLDYSDLSLTKQLVERQTTLLNIRNTLKIKQVTLTSIIDAGIKKGLRDLTLFISLKALDFADTSYHLLKYSQQIIVLLVFNSFIGKDFILLDNLLSDYSPKEIDILFNQILPKTAKISKIVVVDTVIYPSFLTGFYTYIVRKETVEEIKISELVREVKKYQVNYYEDDLLKSKIFNSNEEQLISYIKNKKITNISSDYKLDFKDIEESKR